MATPQYSPAPSGLDKQAFEQDGVPSNDEMKKRGESFIIRHGDTIPAHCLRGQCVNCSCCAASARNVCRQGLASKPAGLQATHSTLVKAMEHWADDWGKEECNHVKKLVMFHLADLDGARCVRMFALMSRAFMSPKFSLWTVCSWAATNSAHVASADLTFPFTLEIQSVPSRVCPALAIAPICTSDELALKAAECMAGDWSANELVYNLCEDEPHLRSMVVTGLGPALAMAKPKRTRMVNNDLQNLRDALREAAGPRVEPAGRSDRRRARRPRGAGDNGAAREGPAHRRGRLDSVGVEQPIDIAMGAIDEIAHDEELDVLIENAEEVAQVVDAMEEGDQLENEPVEEGDADEADERLQVEETAPEPHSFIDGPDSLGYCKDVRTGRSVMRVTPVFKGSVGVRCYVHKGTCTLAIAEWKLPSVMELRKWVAQAEAPPDGLSTDQRKVLARAHVASLARLRDQAVFPGRTRQSLIDEAREMQG